MPREKTITRRKIIVAMMKKECQRVRRKTCRSFFPSKVGYWQTRIGDHCFYNPTDAYYQT